MVYINLVTLLTKRAVLVLRRILCPFNTNVRQSRPSCNGNIPDVVILPQSTGENDTLGQDLNSELVRVV